MIILEDILNMKIINGSKNTLYIDDIDEYMPYRNGEVEYIDPDKLKRSKCLRSFILNNMLEVVEYDKTERIELSLMYLKMKIDKEIKETPKTQEVLKDVKTPVLVRGNDIEVKIHGMFYDAGGYAKVNRNLALNLKEMGFKVQIDPKRGQNQLQAEELKPFIEMENTSLSKNYILIDSIVPSFAEVSSAKHKILYTTIESYTIPKQFLDCCQMYDEIWLTSKWSASVLREYVKDKPIYAVETGVDHELYTEEGPCFDFKPNVKDFVFLSIFGWNYRKGYDVLLKAYFDEFDADDNVSLLIMSRFQSGLSKYHKDKIKGDIDAIMDKFPNKSLPHVVRHSSITPEKDMPKMHRAANAFILTSRGEGGNLPALEATLCGVPLIMTNCSGQQGYLRKEHSYMIDIDYLAEIQPGQMHLHYWDGQKFPALISDSVHKQVRETMRHVYENEEEAKAKNKIMQKYVLANLTWNHTANAAANRIKEIRNGS